MTVFAHYVKTIIHMSGPLLHAGVMMQCVAPTGTGLIVSVAQSCVKGM